MEQFDIQELKELSIPGKKSHKGQNGKLMIIGGSHVFHAASLWALEVASRIVDMVFYASTAENNALVHKAKEEFRNGIIVPRSKIDSYIEEADCILIGPGLPRREGQEADDDNTQLLTQTLLQKYPYKKWVVDGGSLQTITPDILPRQAIITPHHKEFSLLFGTEATNETVYKMAKKYNIIIVSKGDKDIICSNDRCVSVLGGNAGMTKGGTGDVLAGLIAALSCQNDQFLAATAGSYINKKAGESLFQKVGYYFNATDLVHEIPYVMKKIILE